MRSMTSPASVRSASSLIDAARRSRPSRCDPSPKSSRPVCCARLVLELVRVQRHRQNRLLTASRRAAIAALSFLRG